MLLSRINVIFLFSLLFLCLWDKYFETPFLFVERLVEIYHFKKPYLIRSVHGSATHFIDFLAISIKHKNIKYDTSFVLFANNITSVRNVFALNAPFH